MSASVSGDMTDQATGKVGLAQFTAPLFVGRVGEVFRLSPSDDAPGTAGGLFDLELIEVRQPGRGGGEAAREPFALLFALRSRTSLEPGLHRLVHEAFEPDDLFLSRVFVPGRDPRAVYYEAVFG
jgi:hypothetical protein